MQKQPAIACVRVADRGAAPLRGPSTGRAGDVDRTAALAHARAMALADRRRLARKTLNDILREIPVCSAAVREAIVDRAVDHLEALGLELKNFR